MTDSPCKEDLARLDVHDIMAFDGTLTHGLKAHPDTQHLVYAAGCNVMLRNVTTHKVEALKGHKNNVSCIAISRSGRYIASGEVTHMGFKAHICLWDFESRRLESRFELHMVKVEALAFSPNDKYLLSLGGRDDGSIVVWNLCENAKREAICGSPAQVMSAGVTRCIAYAKNSDNVFVSAGDDTLRIWTLDVANRKIKPEAVDVGKIKRNIQCLEVVDGDQTVLCGTSTGDVLVINMDSKIMQHIGPEKQKFNCGITDIALLSKPKNTKSRDYDDDCINMLVGSGDGTVAVMKLITETSSKGSIKTVLKKVPEKRKAVNGAVTSITLRDRGHQFFVGTDKGNLYRFNFAEFGCKLENTYHTTKINDVTFPPYSSELFITCSYEEIRIWHIRSGMELRRIENKNKDCNAVACSMDGSFVISGWNDSTIILYGPETGKTYCTIKDAAKIGVTALAVLSQYEIISGGGNGEMRVWKLVESMRQKPSDPPKYRAELKQTFKEHTASITAIRVSKNNKECVTSSKDGTCIVWDLELGTRKQMIRANNLFMNVLYNASGSQLVTCGTDRKITYWEAYDSSCIRELIGSASGSINALDISPDGDFFVTGGDDKLVKVWDYNSGEVTAVGNEHSREIQAIKISPDGQTIVSVSSDGAIVVWRR